MRQEQFPAVVMYDLDCGWLCEIMQPCGEYESDGGRYGHTEIGRRAALAAGVIAARNAGGRAYHLYESESQIKAKRIKYLAIKSA